MSIALFTPKQNPADLASVTFIDTSLLNNILHPYYLKANPKLKLERVFIL